MAFNCITKNLKWSQGRYAHYGIRVSQKHKHLQVKKRSIYPETGCLKVKAWLFKKNNYAYVEVGELASNIAYVIHIYLHISDIGYWIYEVTYVQHVLDKTFVTNKYTIFRSRISMFDDGRDTAIAIFCYKDLCLRCYVIEELVLQQYTRGTRESNSYSTWTDSYSVREGIIARAIKLIHNTIFDIFVFVIHMSLYVYIYMNICSYI